MRVGGGERVKTERIGGEIDNLKRGASWVKG